MILRDILERANACGPLLDFAAEVDMLKAVATGLGGPRATFSDLWNAIERHDWLTWLMRHCHDQFEDSWRDATSALHAMADPATTIGGAWVYGSSGVSCPEDKGRNSEACRLIRQYVRLRK